MNRRKRRNGHGASTTEKNARSRSLCSLTSRRWVPRSFTGYEFYFVRGMYRIGPLRSAMLMVRLTIVIIALHLLQIVLWAGLYRWSCISSWQSAFYFSTARYSTVGSGDLLLPEMWRTLGP